MLTRRSASVYMARCVHDKFTPGRPLKREGNRMHQGRWLTTSVVGAVGHVLRTFRLVRGSGSHVCGVRVPHQVSTCVMRHSTAALVLHFGAHASALLLLRLSGAPPSNSHACEYRAGSRWCFRNFTECGKFKEIAASCAHPQVKCFIGVNFVTNG
jgi:hypothetical protein